MLRQVNVLFQTRDALSSGGYSSNAVFFFLFLYRKLSSFVGLKDVYDPLDFATPHYFLVEAPFLFFHSAAYPD